MSNTSLNLDANLTATLSQGLPGLTSTKECNACGKSLPHSHFYKNCSSRDGYRNQCKACVEKADNERFQSNPYARCLTNTKHRAKRKGLAFDLDESFLRDIDRDVCPYLEIPIVWNMGKRVGRAADNSKSIDRIDSSKGYTKDNVIVCSMRANQILSNSTLPEISLIAHNFRRILNSTQPTNADQTTGRR